MAGNIKHYFGKAILFLPIFLAAVTEIYFGILMNDKNNEDTTYFV